MSFICLTLILPLLTISNALSHILSLKPPQNQQQKTPPQKTCFNWTFHLTPVPSMFTKDLSSISFLWPHSEVHFLLFLSISSPSFHKSSSVLHKLTSWLTLQLLKISLIRMHSFPEIRSNIQNSDSWVKWETLQFWNLVVFKLKRVCALLFFCFSLGGGYGTPTSSVFPSTAALCWPPKAGEERRRRGREEEGKESIDKSCIETCVRFTHKTMHMRSW